MNATVPLSGSRVRLRLWRAEDREPFALMNFDARIMKFFRSPLGRIESDEVVDRIQKHFEDQGFGLWALEVPGTAPFIGFCGLSVARFSAHFTPCVEVGWRLAYEHWGQGYATEAAKVAVHYGFSELNLPEIVSFTSKCNLRSRAVMERLGMRQDPADDFDHPGLPPAHPLARHVLYRLKNKVDVELSLQPIVR
jgi:ribosomal-protein-alanine N-acetyltransferase